MNNEAEETRVPQEEAQEPRDEAIEEAAETAHAEAPGTEEAAAEPGPEEQIQKLSQERDEYLEMAKRQMAEFANYRRRTENARKEAEEDGRVSVIRAFLPVVDNLERALLAAGQEASPLQEGMEMVVKQALSVLGSLGVSALDPLGEPFNAETMNAVLQGTEEEGEPGTVCQVLQKGYLMGQRVVRHAIVKVVAG